MTRIRSGESSSPTPSWKRRLAILFGGILVISLCVAIRYLGGGPEKADATPPRRAAASNAPARASARGTSAPARPAETFTRNGKPLPRVVATVNGKPITRDDLARECLRHYGKEVLESLVNKYLIVEECRRRNLRVTRDEVDREIERMASRFGLPVDQWLKMLKSERGITPGQYAEDIIWPTLALRKLAGTNLQISREELVREYDIMYGEMIRARLISCKNLETAEKLREMAVADPDNFGNLAKDYSKDKSSAAAKGLIRPIRKHGTFKELEQAAFTMADGEISPVIRIEDQFVILKREGAIPARNVQLESVAGKLEELIRNRKMRSLSSEVFKTLQKNAQVENIFNDPTRRKQAPGIAATINGQPITLRALAQACIDRHGTEVLEGTINRTLLELACQKRGVTMSEQELEEEIVRAATLGVPPKDDGSPDVEAWLKEVTEKQGVPLEIYRSDAVWPSVALRKLAGDNVEVSDEDLQRGFEANYGPRVRCLAIVLNNFRRAQEVFDKARKKNTSEYFGYLAEQYSIEPGSQALCGEVPPIKKWSGQPILEKEAFSLKPGEISGVIQVADKFVILRCEGYTRPVEVQFEEVREQIRHDLYEKKLRLAMAAYFEKLQDAATIDNYVSAKRRAPRKPRATGMGAARLPTLRQTPGNRR